MLLLTAWRIHAIVGITMNTAKGYRRETEGVVTGSLYVVHYFILWMPALFELT